MVKTGVMVTPVDRPQETPIHAAMDRVRHCPKGVPDTHKRQQKHNAKTPETKKSSDIDANPQPDFVHGRGWHDYENRDM